MEIIKYSDDGSEKLYDLTIVSQMCRGNQDMIVQMVNVFIGEITKAVEEVKLAFNTKDISEIKKLVHKTKPTLTYYGTVKIEKELLDIENILEKEYTEEILGEKIGNLETITIIIVNYLKNGFNIK